LGVFLPVIVLNCLILFPDEKFGTTPDVDIKNVVLAQDIAVRAHNPDARLFQVFLPDCVPEPKLSEHNSDVEIHSYFEINRTQEFLELITKDSKEMVEVAKPFEGHNCFHGYPESRSEACSPTVQPPATDDDYLGLDWILDLPKLARAFRRYGLDPSKHFDVTIVSARRIIDTWKWSDVRTGSSVRERMDKEQSKQVIISATEHSSVGHGDGETWLFRAADYESLGAVTFASSRRLPPARKNSTTAPSPH
jgi:hypothetical protein